MLTDPGLVPVLQLKKIQLSASYLNLFANYYLITMYIKIFDDINNYYCGNATKFINNTIIFYTVTMSL